MSISARPGKKFFATTQTGFHAVDGFHLNAGGFPGYCYCANCQDKFRTRFGISIPSAADWSGAAWKQFIAWRYDVSAENFAHLHGVMQEVRRDVFWTGELAGLDDPSWTRNRAYDIVRLSRSMTSLMSTIDNITPGRPWLTAPARRIRFSAFQAEATTTAISL